MKKLEELKEYIDNNRFWSEGGGIECDVDELNSLIQSAIEEEREKAWNSAREKSEEDALIDSGGWKLEYYTYESFSDWQKQNPINLGGAK